MFQCNLLVFHEFFWYAFAYNCEYHQSKRSFQPETTAFFVNSTHAISKRHNQNML